MKCSQLLQCAKSVDTDAYENYKVNYTYDAEGLRTSKTVNGEKQFCLGRGSACDVTVGEWKGTETIYSWH